jgi:hypothetical protein
MVQEKRIRERGRIHHDFDREVDIESRGGLDCGLHGVTEHPLLKAMGHKAEDKAFVGFPSVLT